MPDGEDSEYSNTARKSHFLKIWIGLLLILGGRSEEVDTDNWRKIDRLVSYAFVTIALIVLGGERSSFPIPLSVGGPKAISTWESSEERDSLSAPAYTSKQSYFRTMQLGATKISPTA